MTDPAEAPQHIYYDINRHRPQFVDFLVATGATVLSWASPQHATIVEHAIRELDRRDACAPPLAFVCNNSDQIAYNVM